MPEAEGQELADLAALRTRWGHHRTASGDFTQWLGAAKRLARSTYDWPRTKDLVSRFESNELWKIAGPTETRVRDLVQHNLPDSSDEISRLFGVKDHQVELRRALRSSNEHVISCIGRAGVGKTALVLKVLSDMIDQRDSAFRAVEWRSGEDPGALVVFEPPALQFAAHDERKGSVVVIDAAERLREQPTDFSQIFADETVVIVTSRTDLGTAGLTIRMGDLDARSATVLFRHEARLHKLTQLESWPDNLVRDFVSRLRLNPQAIKLAIRAIGSGAEPSEVISDRTDMLRHSFDAIFASLPPIARALAGDLYCLARPAALSELTVVCDVGFDAIKQALGEIDSAQLLERGFSAAGSLARTYALCASARDYISLLAPPDQIRQSQVREADRDILTAGARFAMGSWTRGGVSSRFMFVRSALDVPAATALVNAQELRGWPEAWHEIDRARQLAPDYFEVERVSADMFSYSSRFDEADAAYREAYRLAGEANAGIVAYHQSGELLGRGDLTRALAVAREANDRLSSVKSTIRLATTLMAAGKHADAERYLRRGLMLANGYERILITTQLIELGHRNAESLAEDDSATWEAFRAAFTAFRQGVDSVRAGLSDTKLVDELVEVASTAFRIAAELIDLSSVGAELRELATEMGASRRDWILSTKWSYCAAHFQRLLRHPAVSPEWRAELRKLASQPGPVPAPGAHSAGRILSVIAQRHSGFIMADGCDRPLYFSFSALTPSQTRQRILFEPGAQVDFRVDHMGDGRVRAVDVGLGDQTKCTRLAWWLHGEVAPDKREKSALVIEKETGAVVLLFRFGLADSVEWEDLLPGDAVTFRASFSPNLCVIRGTLHPAEPRPPATWGEGGDSLPATSDGLSPFP
jgi:tetratricopeptide (TPR) repeat protein